MVKRGGRRRRRAVGRKEKNKDGRRITSSPQSSRAPKTEKDGKDEENIQGEYDDAAPKLPVEEQEEVGETAKRPTHYVAENGVPMVTKEGPYGKATTNGLWLRGFDQPDFERWTINEGVRLDGRIRATTLGVWRLDENQKLIKTPQNTSLDLYSKCCVLVMKTYVRDASHNELHIWAGHETTSKEQAMFEQRVEELIEEEKLQNVTTHRESEFHESEVFLSYFKLVRHLSGTLDAEPHSGTVASERRPRLYLVKHDKTRLYLFEVDRIISNLNHENVFLLDTGNDVHIWSGDMCRPIERSHAQNYAQQIVYKRRHARKLQNADPAFWKALGANGNDNVRKIGLTVSETLEAASDESFANAELHRMSDASGLWYLVFGRSCDKRRTITSVRHCRALNPQALHLKEHRIDRELDL